MDLVPERRRGEESVSPGTADLSTDVCKVRYDFGCKGADVGKDLGWEFVDGCEHVSERSGDADSSNEAFFGVDNLIKHVNGGS